MHSNSAAAPPFLIHNGVLRAVADEVIALPDNALARGQGAFETFAARHGQLFRAHAHFERLHRTAALLELACPPDAEFVAATERLLAANELTGVARSRIRITLTSPAAGGPSWFVEAGAVPRRREQARVVTIPFVRNERGALAGLKTTNYGENVVAMRLAREAGADEALFGNTRDELCEGTWSNVFLYRDGTFLTPPLSSGCLPGVTRALVLDLGRALGLAMRETTIPLADLPSAEAAFLTSSLREIQTISAIDGRPLPEAPSLPRLREAFAALDPDPA
ncbi:MAG: 4-amino-4-deoxychorismate lyase [Verrucomicrobiaceae bacterium]|nr:4-amino-4-deoxychorismate lyase [Verrucomicrobiaceae bacterium]